MKAFCISYEDFRKIIAYAMAASEELSAEIGGQAVVEEGEDYILIKDPQILKQEVSGGGCTLDKEALANYYTSMATKHGTDISFCWWHSHKNNAAFFSMKDDETIEASPSKHYAVSLVVNSKRDHKFRVDVFEPAHMKTETVPLTILGAPEEIPEEIRAEVNAKCTKETAIVVAKKGQKGYKRKKKATGGEDETIIGAHSPAYQTYLDRYHGEEPETIQGGAFYERISAGEMALYEAENFELASALVTNVGAMLDSFREGNMEYEKLEKAVKRLNMGKVAKDAGIKFELPSRASIHMRAAGNKLDALDMVKER